MLIPDIASLVVHTYVSRVEYFVRDHVFCSLSSLGLRGFDQEEKILFEEEENFSARWVEARRVGRSVVGQLSDRPNRSGFVRSWPSHTPNSAQLEEW